MEVAQVFLLFKARRANLEVPAKALVCSLIGAGIASPDMFETRPALASSR